MGNNRLLFTKGFQQAHCKSIRSMKKRVKDRWKIQEQYLTNEDVIQAQTLRDLLELQKKRSGRKRKETFDKKLHNNLVICLKRIVDKAIVTDIMDNDYISPDIRYYIEDLHTLLTTKSGNSM